MGPGGVVPHSQRMLTEFQGAGGWDFANMNAPFFYMREFLVQIATDYDTSQTCVFERVEHFLADDAAKMIDGLRPDKDAPAADKA